MKTAILTFQKRHGRKHGSIGSSIIRGAWLARYWPEAELYTEGMQSDAIILQKVYWDRMIDAYPGIIILDICDPDWLKIGDGRLEIVRLSKKIDAITCSSKGIYNYLKKFVQIPIKYIPDRIDLEFFDLQNPKIHYGKAQNVIWFGYHNNAKEVLPNILSSLASRRLNLTVISDIDFDPRLTYGVQITNKRFSWDTIKFDLQRADMAINPQPINIVSRFRFKSQNKTWISWACGLPVANSADDMDRLMDPDERQKKIDKKIQWLKENADVRQSVKQFKELIEQIKNERAKNN